MNNKSNITNGHSITNADVRQSNTRVYIPVDMEGVKKIMGRQLLIAKTEDELRLAHIDMGLMISGASRTTFNYRMAVSGIGSEVNLLGSNPNKFGDDPVFPPFSVDHVAPNNNSGIIIYLCKNTLGDYFLTNEPVAYNELGFDASLYSKDLVQLRDNALHHNRMFECENGVELEWVEIVDAVMLAIANTIIHYQMNERKYFPSLTWETLVVLNEYVNRCLANLTRAQADLMLYAPLSISPTSRMWMLPESMTPLNYYNFNPPQISYVTDSEDRPIAFLSPSESGDTLSNADFVKEYPKNLKEPFKKVDHHEPRWERPIDNEWPDYHYHVPKDEKPGDEIFKLDLGNIFKGIDLSKFMATGKLAIGPLDEGNDTKDIADTSTGVDNTGADNLDKNQSDDQQEEESDNE